MSILFGTDGVRGLANLELTSELTMTLARLSPEVIAPGRLRPRFLVGKDTRASGDLLEAAAVAGLCSAGADVLIGGVMPTPALAYLVLASGLDGGIMISASHNPYQYNGLKFFGPGGDKLSDEQQAQMEALVEQPSPNGKVRAVGRTAQDGFLIQSYVNQITGLAQESLQGLRLIVDCGHGAYCELAPRVFAHLGAEVTAMNCSPTGMNINEGGAVKPQELAQAVREQGADAGVAFDGDGDRVVLLDEKGALVDGDHILGLWASDLQSAGRLAGNIVVGTVITNGGLERFLHSLGCSLVRVPVGDRNVSAEMKRRGAVLGGETCGHIIFSPHLSSADGLLVSATVLSLMARTRRPLSALASTMRKRPQVSTNIPIGAHLNIDSDLEVSRAIREAEDALGEGSWLVVRASGTEPVIRVTAECDDEARAQQVVQGLAAAIEQRTHAAKGASDVPSRRLVRSH